MTLIGLSGYARSGKDSVAAVLVQNNGFERRAFADTLRNALVALNPSLKVHSGVNGGVEVWPLATAVKLWGWEKLKETAPDSRLLLQRLGTEVGRNMLGENIWVDATLPDIVFDDVVVTDCRFENEAKAVKQRGGVLVRIDRPGVGPANDHISERGLDNAKFDYHLINDGSLDDLVDDVGAMLQALDLQREERTETFLSLLR